MVNDVERLVRLFDTLFALSENTCLLGGSTEPLYRPASADGQCATVIFTHDYFASALHEVAHWCIAGRERRQHEDYGYWYIANRNTAQQAAFEQAEVKPQALEKVFTECAGRTFKPSLDCLQHPEYRAPEFMKRVNAQYSRYKRQGLPPRAMLFATALATEFGGERLGVLESGAHRANPVDARRAYG